MGFFSSIFGNSGGGKNPADAARPYLEQIPGTMKPYYNPYINTGREALGQSMGEYSGLIGQRGDIENSLSDLLNNPQELYRKLTSQFQTSPGYDFMKNEALGAAGHAAAAGGLAGSPQHQRYAEEAATGLAGREFENYLSHILGMYGQGLQGKQNLYGAGLQGLGNLTNLGYGASSELAQNLAQALMSQANLEYAGQANQNQSRGGLFGAGLGAIGGGIGGFMQGGWPGAAEGAAQGASGSYPQQNQRQRQNQNSYY
jgi:hypothetical protein